MVSFPENTRLITRLKIEGNQRVRRNSHEYFIWTQINENDRSKHTFMLGIRQTFRRYFKISLLKSVLSETTGVLRSLYQYSASKKRIYKTLESI